jgi:hypothetical protein
VPQGPKPFDLLGIVCQGRPDSRPLVAQDRAPHNQAATGHRTSHPDENLSGLSRPETGLLRGEQTSTLPVSTPFRRIPTNDTRVPLRLCPFLFFLNLAWIGRTCGLALRVVFLLEYHLGVWPECCRLMAIRFRFPSVYRAPVARTEPTFSVVNFSEPRWRENDNDRIRFHGFCWVRTNTQPAS